MRFLNALLTKFRRPRKAAEAYDAEVLFAGWVQLPPRPDEGRNQRAPAADSRRAISA